MSPKRKNKTVLSVIIPAFNEMATIEMVIKAVKNCSVKNKEIIVVDDGSTDGTREWLKNNARQVDRLILRAQNGGKGRAIRDGVKAATGDIVVIQDADLEYDPTELEKLIQPIIDDRADVVYGSRFVGSEPHRVAYFWHYLGNVLLTFLSNSFTNLNLTDMETGYKAFRRSVIEKIEITERSFGLEPELTAKMAAQQVRVYEMGISYHGRTYEEGKKIGLPDFFRALWVIAKFGILTKF